MPHRNIGCIVGVFDLFHIGHLDQLRLAAGRFDELVVALPSDDLMESRTGERPFVPQTERAEIVGAMRGVTRVDLVEHLDLTALVRQSGARAVLLPVDDDSDDLADDVHVPVEVVLEYLDEGRTTRSGAILAALRRTRGGTVGEVA